MKTRITLILILIYFIAVIPILAQDRFPAREYTNPDELIILTEDVSFSDAIDLIQDFASEYKDKIIVNQSSFEGSIGISVPQMHWQDALERIAAHNNLVVDEYPRYFEIYDRPAETPEARERAAERIEEQRVDFNTREIEINATFFQGDRSAIRETGIDWSTLSSSGRVQIDQTTTQNVQQSALDISGSWADILDSGWDIQALFSAFESNQKGEILSSPTIKVIDGEAGSIQVGQDISIKQRDIAGNITDQFFNTGTILRVTPNVLYSDDGTPFIYMTVNAERSTGQPDPVSTIINKQEASTDLLLLSGESAIIAGLYETEEVVTRRGIPILKDVPLLKYLFGYNSTEYVTQELVVLIKASLVPTLQERMDAPFDNMPNLLRQQRDTHQNLQNIPDAQ